MLPVIRVETPAIAGNWTGCDAKGICNYCAASLGTRRGYEFGRHPREFCGWRDTWGFLIYDSRQEARS